MNGDDHAATVHRFLEETCCFSPLAVAPVNELFEAFRTWCAERGLRPGMVQRFSTAVVSRKGVYFDLRDHGGTFRRVFVGVSAQRCLCSAA